MLLLLLPLRTLAFKGTTGQIRGPALETEGPVSSGASAWTVTNTKTIGGASVLLKGQQRALEQSFGPQRRFEELLVVANCEVAPNKLVRPAGSAL